ncbi:MAG: hypothetical protein K6T26_07935 [Alicyclobacillus sp.]|nr:hypothetical protein [Alicyclobacillus sp.]
MSGSFLPICAIVPVHGDTSALVNVYRQLHRAGVQVCITVLNGTAPPLAAAAATQQAANLGLHCTALTFSTALGPDVPRAIGAIAALRRKPEIPWLLFLDGDWQGGFGPMLGEWICHAESRPGVWFQAAPVHESLNPPSPGSLEPPSGSCRGQTLIRGDWRRAERPDLQVWQSAWLHPCWPGPGRGVNPAEPPWLIHRTVFVEISPLWLYHPGLWYACCVAAAKHGLPLHIWQDWDSRCTGNPVRSAAHTQAMHDTLWGDALEAARLLLGQRPSRRWQGRELLGYHTQRRLDVLLACAATWSWAATPSATQADSK